MRLLPPDDAADLVQEAEHDKRERLLALLDEPTRKEVTALLAYAEDDAGGLMNPRYARVRPDMTADEVNRYLEDRQHERPPEAVAPSLGPVTVDITCQTRTPAAPGADGTASSSRSL